MAGQSRQANSKNVMVMVYRLEEGKIVESTSTVAHYLNEY